MPNKRSVYEMTDKEFDKWVKTASAKELSNAFCADKTPEQIEKDIAEAERMDSNV